MRVLLLSILTITTPYGLSAQVIADTVLLGFELVAEFDEAVSIAASPDGAFYVVDQGASTIHQFGAGGSFARRLGGPGSAAGQFDAPAAMDPTNGLILVVADEGNGRIQRFSREFLYLESLPVGNYERGRLHAFPDQPRYRQDEGASLSGPGRPIDVRVTSDNRMYAIDAEAQIVVEWDQDRNITQVLGEYYQGEGTLVNPVALEIGSEGALFVLDADLGSIRVYDAFGGYLREMGTGLLGEAVTMKRINTELFVVVPGFLLVFHERGLLEYRIGFENDILPVDVLYTNGYMYILTQKELLRYTGDARAILKLDDL